MVVPIEPQVFDVLRYLIDHRDRVVPKTELLDNIWGDRFVSESALTSRVKAARRAVGDDGQHQRIIRTAFGRGYQFVASLSPASALGDGDEPSAADAGRAAPFAQQIRFCTTPGGHRLAYATSGSGPPLVRAANWMTHLDHDAESPVWRHWLDGLGNGRTLIRYDERGCGLSDWEVGPFDFEDWVLDLETVVDAVGADRFPLIGISQGAAVAVAFAARHPHRVSRLILVGGYARGRLVRARTPEALAAAALDLELARVGWGRDDPSFRQVFAAQFLPDASRHEWDRFDDLQRQTTSAENAVRFLETFAGIDITALAPAVRCPTLVVHSRDDHRVPLAQGRELATLIPGSQLVALASANHLLTATEPAWPRFLSELDEFLAAP